jgi:hypothetical protein
MSDHDAHAHPEHHGHGNEELPSDHPEADVHGMLVVGEKQVFLSHLPMFGHPHHDVQAILSAQFSRDGGDPKQEYADDRRGSGERVYTLEPRLFFLDSIAHHGPGEECMCVFQGNIYRGHFERQGTNILRDVTVTVNRVIQFRRFDPDASPLPELAYILFGAGDECFLGHLVTRPPDFDQVLSIQLVSGAISDEKFRRGPIITVPGRANDIRQRLKAGEQVSVKLDGTTAPIAVTVERELYLEEGELGVRFSQEPTAEELAAGF